MRHKRRSYSEPAFHPPFGTVLNCFAPAQKTSRDTPPLLVEGQRILDRRRRLREPLHRCPLHGLFDYLGNFKEADRTGKVSSDGDLVGGVENIGSPPACRQGGAGELQRRQTRAGG